MCLLTIFLMTLLLFYGRVDRLNTSYGIMLGFGIGLSLSSHKDQVDSSPSHVTRVQTC